MKTTTVHGGAVSWNVTPVRFDFDGRESGSSGRLMAPRGVSQPAPASPSLRTSITPANTYYARRWAKLRSDRPTLHFDAFLGWRP